MKQSTPGLWRMMSAACGRSSSMACQRPRRLHLSRRSMSTRPLHGGGRRIPQPVPRALNHRMRVAVRIRVSDVPGVDDADLLAARRPRRGDESAPRSNRTRFESSDRPYPAHRSPGGHSASRERPGRCASDPRSLRKRLGHTSVSLREHGSPWGSALLVGSMGSAEGRAAAVSRAETSRAPRAVGTSLGMAQSRTRRGGPGVSSPCTGVERHATIAGPACRGQWATTAGPAAEHVFNFSKPG
jgi:hypothetical protein